MSRFATLILVLGCQIKQVYVHLFLTLEDDCKANSRGAFPQPRIYGASLTRTKEPFSLRKTLDSVFRPFRHFDEHVVVMALV